MATDGQDWQTLLSEFSPRTIAPRASSPEEYEAPGALLREALSQLPSLRELFADAAATGVPLTLVVNDAHRATDTRAILDAFFTLAADAVRDRALPRMRLLVAAGTHQSIPAERREHEQRILGPHAAKFQDIVWHGADDDAELASVGSYRFHRWMAEAGIYLGCGSMEPHYFAGVTGAHKTLTVGVMSRAGVEANHAGAMSPSSGPFRLSGNPVHDGICAALAALESSGAELYALNQIIVGGRIVQATSGRPLEALTQGLPLVRRSFGHRVSEPLDFLVAQVAPPLDRDVYQADKGIKNTEAAVRDGGLLILDAACHAGVGIDHFVELLRQAPAYDDALRIVSERGYRLGDHKAVRLRYLSDRRGVRLALVTPNIDPATAGLLGMTVFADRAKAAAWASGLLRPGAKGLLVRDAGNLTVELQKD